MASIRIEGTDYTDRGIAGELINRRAQQLRSSGKEYTVGELAGFAVVPLLVWFRRPKLYVLAAITCLQLGIAVLIPNVTFFTLAMVCAFWVYVPASAVRELTVKLWRILERVHRMLSPTKQ